MNGRELRIDKQILKTIRMNYLLYVPLTYDENDSKKWPLILYLHGAGGSGTQPDAIRREGLPARVESERNFPFIVVAPQCPLGAFWNTREDEVLAILDDLEEQWHIDSDRVYLTGFSMGAYGVWQLAEHHPERFAAIAPVSGGGDPTHARTLQDMPTWIFHGIDDQVIRCSESEKMAEAMRNVGAEVELTLYPGMGHDCWKKVYVNEGLYRWFLEHVSSPRRVARTGEKWMEAYQEMDTNEPRHEQENQHQSLSPRPDWTNGESALGLYHDGSQRLRIELVSENDVNDLLEHELKNQAFFRQFTATRDDSFYTYEEQVARVQRSIDAAAADKRYTFMVRERESGLLIGGVDLMDVKRGSLQSALIGYSMDGDYNGKGYMTEAVRFVVRHAFEVLALHRIEAGVMPHNQGSLRVLEKAGFEREGLCRRNVNINGRWQDHVLLAIVNPKDLAEEA